MVLTVIFTAGEGATTEVAAALKALGTPEGVEAAVILEENVPKPDWNGPIDYSALPEPRNVGPDKPFTKIQHDRIIEHNKKMNNGVIRDDENGEVLNPAKQSKRGVAADMNQAELDHVNPRKPKDKTKPPGTNSNKNVKVRSKGANIKKSNN